MSVAGFRPAMTRSEALDALAAAFSSAGLANPRREARLALLAALDADATELIARPQLPLGPDAPRLAEICTRRLGHEPLSRILGRREFFGLELGIGANVLDPRPDTETLVEAVLDHAARRAMNARPLDILDLGTGSGAILAALLAHLPEATGTATDRSQAALDCAATNFDRLGYAGRYRTVLSDWFDAVEGQFDCVVSNPPYIARGALPGLEPGVRLFDPKSALDGGPDGLDAYRCIAGGLANRLRPGGFVAVEVGAGQAAAVASLFRQIGCTIAELRRDLAGIERVVVADFSDNSH